LLVAAGVLGCGGETPDPFAQDLGGNVFIEVIPKRAAAISSTPSGIDCDSAWARLGNGTSDPADRSGCRFGFFDGQQVRLDAAVRANYEIVGWEWSNVAQLIQSAPGGYTSICAGGPTCTLPALVETGRDYFVRLTLQPEPPPFAPGQNQLIDPGFELQAYRTGVSPVIPSGTGYWQGDLATIVTGAENGISPESGAKMLRCDASGPFGGGAGFIGCEVYQILDVSQFASLIDQDSVTFEAAVRVNRVAGDSETDRRFSLGAYALQGPPTTAPTGLASALASWTENLVSDDIPATWELIETGARALPPGTRSIVFRLFATEDVFDDPGAGEFDGHYFDTVSLVLSKRAMP